MEKLNREDLGNGQRKYCYCLNRDCLEPQNSIESHICVSCGANLLLQNRYRALKLIGQGGFGRTFKAIDESQANRPYYAIKQFWVESHHRDKAAELFAQEAERLKELGKHPNIPALQDYFVEDSGQYLVQEFILGDNLERDKVWTEAEITEFLLNILPLIQFVHQQKIIHRDIKPENIIRRQDGSLVLVDFGAAKLVTEASSNKTSTAIGSAAYTAPEQLQGKATFASDIYSLAVTCIHLLTQLHPFRLFDSNQNTWNWREYLTKPVSPKLGKILDKMLEGAIARRYQSIEVILQDLQGVSFKPKNKIDRNKLFGTTAAIALAILGLRALIYPVTQQVSNSNSVSTPRVQNPSPQTQTNIAPRINPNPSGLYSYTDDGQLRSFPLEHTAVDAKISGNLARVEVKQTFSNPYNNPLEAIYQFPLPDDAAVDEMEIQIGDRIIRGDIKKKQEAQQIYQQAKKEGKTAGLLEQQKDNIFTQSLANIQPGQKIDVIIRYTNTLQFIGSDYEFAFPLTVAPRFGGDNTSTNFNPLISPVWADELSPTRSGKDIDVNIEIDAGVAIAGVQSPSHTVSISNNNSSTRVALTDRDLIPNQDLILRYQVAGADTQATVLTQSNQQGGHFATYLIPAVEYDDNQIVPKDVIFLMDTSGSQAGAAIEQSKELMRQFISGLNPEDTFNIIDFADRTSKLAEQPLANTRENRAKALAYVSKISANGGTQLMNGINTVLDFPATEDGRLRSIVLLSDGLIGADEQAIGRIRDELKPGNRLYSFGVGNSTNRFLLNRLAELGRGTVTILPPNEDAVKVADKFYREINKPIVTNIEMEWLGEGKPPEIYPQQAPDLFASQPLVLYGRKQDANNGKLKITGMVAGGKTYEKVLDVNFQQIGGNNAIAQLWGRSRIKDLSNQNYGIENPQTIEAITQTALDYNLLSKYTAFVAVDEKLPESTSKPKDLSAKVNPRLNSARANSASNNQSVPEPSEIIGNLLALICLILFFTRKRWTHFVKLLIASKSR